MENTCSGYAATMHDPGSSERQAVTAEKVNSAQLCGYLCVPLRLPLRTSAVTSAQLCGYLCGYLCATLRLPLRLNKTSLAEGTSPPERNFWECSLKGAGKQEVLVGGGLYSDFCVRVVFLI